MVPLLAVLCAAVVAVSLLGGALPLATALTHIRLQLYLSFAAGVMLGAAFFHMMPEAVELGSASVLKWVAVGLLSLFFVERFFAFHHHEAPADPLEPCPTHAHEHGQGHGGGHSAGLVDPAAPGKAGAATKGSALHSGAAAFGLAVHTLTGGVALASVLEAEGGMGPGVWGVFLATLVHKPADALTIVSLMLRAGVPRVQAHLVNLGFALMIPLGAAIFWVGMRHSSGAVAGAHRALPGVLGRDVPLHRPERPPARAPVSRPRPLEAVGGAPGRRRPDGAGGGDGSGLKGESRSHSLPGDWRLQAQILSTTVRVMTITFGRS